MGPPDQGERELIDVASLAYAAGIIDGEGTIGITEYEPRGKRKSPQFRCYMAVTMTDPVVPMLLAEWFGGTVHSYPGRKPGHKVTHSWRLGARRAAAACEVLLPFLRVKRAQAELLVDFYNDPRFEFTQRKQLPVDEAHARRGYVDQIHVLNGRGA